MQPSAQNKVQSEREAMLEAQEAMDRRRLGGEKEGGAAEGAAAVAFEPPLKVERKFLVGEVPKVLGLRDGMRVSQGYLAVERDGSEVRIRRTDKGAALLVKNAAGKNQMEVEVPLSSVQLEALWPLTEGRRMSKVTYQLEVSDTPITLDMYEGQLSWLHIAEAEFPGPTTAEAFTPPAWFKREVSDLPAYRHSNLARE